MSSNIKKLKEITPKLEDLSHQVHRGIVNYEAKKGLVYGVGLLKEDVVAVQKVFFSEGAVLQEHHHDVQEYLVLFSGKAEITCCCKTEDMREGKCFHIKPGRVHTVTAEKETWMLAVSMPSDKGFPDARE